MIDELRQMLHSGKNVTIIVKVRANASCSEIREVMDDGTLKIDIACVAERGMANAELIKLLAYEFDIDKGSVSILSGHTSPRKKVRLTNTP